MNLRKIELLRSIMVENSLSAYLIPSHDEFLGEYTAVENKRLEWLTEFSGSNGTAVILRNKAAFFTDGRYMLQAAKEIDQNYFEIHNFKDTSIVKWLRDNIQSGEIIGYDPKLYTNFMLNPFIHSNLKIEAIEGNLVDKIWLDKEISPITPIFIHPLKYAGIGFEDKLESIINLLKINNIDALFVSRPDSICWLLNIRGQDVPYTPLVLCRAIIYSSGEVELFTYNHHMSIELREYFQKRVNILNINHLPDSINKLRNKNLQVDERNATKYFIDMFKKLSINLIFEDDPCQLKKACKNDVEIQGAVNCHIRDGIAVCKLLHWLEISVAEKRSITEIDIVAQLFEFRKEQKYFMYESFATIAGFNTNGAIIHYRPNIESNLMITQGLLLLDSGGQYLDGTTDITRTVAIGDPSPEQKLHFTLVLKGHIAIANAKFIKGTSGSELDILARYALWQEGLDYDHSTGHGVGSYLSVHEGPQNISKSHKQIALEENMILSNEPGYYLDNLYGIRIENLIRVIALPKISTPKKEFLGFSNLTMVPIDTNLIDFKLLSKFELDWLNEYHSEVWNTLHTNVNDDKLLEWLRNKTKKIIIH